MVAVVVVVVVVVCVSLSGLQGDGGLFAVVLRSGVYRHWAL